MRRIGEVKKLRMRWRAKEMKEKGGKGGRWKEEMERVGFMEMRWREKEDKGKKGKEEEEEKEERRGRKRKRSEGKGKEKEREPCTGELIVMAPGILMLV